EGEEARVENQAILGNRFDRVRAKQSKQSEREHEERRLPQPRRAARQSDPGKHDRFGGPPDRDPASIELDGNCQGEERQRNADESQGYRPRILGHSIDAARRDEIYDRERERKRSHPAGIPVFEHVIAQPEVAHSGPDGDDYFPRIRPRARELAPRPLLEQEQGKDRRQGTPNKQSILRPVVTLEPETNADPVQKKKT